MIWALEKVEAGPGGRAVLKGVSLQVAPGEVVGVVGPNGAGKTTLLRAGLGLLPLKAGAVRIAGKPLSELGDADRARLCGYLAQERRIGWNLPVGRIVELGCSDLPEGEARAVALTCLARVGLPDAADRGVLDLSGGERARVLLARFLATRASLMVADEPAAGLDPDAQLLALELFGEEAARGAAVVLTLHDLGLAARACDRIIVLAEGQVVAEGPPDEALSAEVLKRAVGLSGGLIDTPHGPVLAVSRF